MQRSRSLAVAFLLGATLAGGALGFTADRMMAHSRPLTGKAAQASKLDQLSADLSLTPTQRATVESILDDRHRQFQEAMKPVRPKLDSIRLNSRTQIMNVLDASQQAKFKALIDEMERERAKQEKK